MLDSREDVKVGEGADDAEEDNGLYRSVRCVQRERSEESPHDCVVRWTVCRSRTNDTLLLKEREGE